MTPTLRERQRQETHELIRRTAVALVIERGVAEVSVQQVCAAAGISPRTFFNHFRSKDEALLPDFPPFPADAERAFVAADEPRLVAALGRLLGEHLDELPAEPTGDDGPRAVQRMVEANPELLPRALAVFGALEDRVTALVARRTGRSPDDLACRVAALAATSALRAVFMSSDGAADAGAVRQRTDEAFAVLGDLSALDGPPPAVVDPRT